MTVKNDTNNVAVTPQRETSWITRRKMIQVTAVGGLVAVAGLPLAYKMSKNKKHVLTEITIEGPFKEYGYFSPEDLGRKDIRNLDSDFKLETLILNEGKYHDDVMIAFTFAGIEDSNRKMRVFLTAYGKGGIVIGGSQDDFADPRIMAREAIYISKRGVRAPIATLSMKLPSQTALSQVGEIRISVVEMPIDLV